MKPRPQAATGLDPFEFCKKEGIIGIGFPLDKEPEDKEDALSIFEENETYRTPSNRSTFGRFLCEVQIGNFVWLQNNGRYFLCRIESDWDYNDSDVYMDHDICNFRKAGWKEMPHELVPGNVVRSLATRGTLKSVKASEASKTYVEYLHICEISSLSADRASLEKVIRNVRDGDIDVFKILDPEECEDLISVMMQTEGWLFLTSSSSHNRPKYESDFKRIAGERVERASLQVKSGNQPIDVEEYVDDANERFVYLFSAKPKEPYINENLVTTNPNIRLVRRDKVIKWLSRYRNMALLRDSTINKLLACVQAQEWGMRRGNEQRKL